MFNHFATCLPPLLFFRSPSSCFSSFLGFSSFPWFSPFSWFSSFCVSVGADGGLLKSMIFSCRLAGLPVTLHRIILRRPWLAPVCCLVSGKARDPPVAGGRFSIWMAMAMDFYSIWGVKPNKMPGHLCKTSREGILKIVPSWPLQDPMDNGKIWHCDITPVRGAFCCHHPQQRGRRNNLRPVNASNKKYVRRRGHWKMFRIGGIRRLSQKTKCINVSVTMTMGKR